MSAETFTTAIFLITAVIAAGVLVNAVLPVVYTMAGTFSSSTHDSDERLRTDFKIVTYYYSSSTSYANIWMKNIGSSRITINDLHSRAEVFCGQEGDFERLAYTGSYPPGEGEWTTEFEGYSSYDLNSNEYWDPGETLHVIAHPATSVSEGQTIYFQFILPSGFWRSQTFTAS
jgi:flagellar protein FlaG